MSCILVGKFYCVKAQNCSLQIGWDGGRTRCHQRFLFTSAVGGLCVFVVDWRHAFRSEWPYIYYFYFYRQHSKPDQIGLQAGRYPKRFTCPSLTHHREPCYHLSHSVNVITVVICRAQSKVHGHKTITNQYYFCMTQETARRLPFRCYTRKGSDLDQSQQRKDKTSEINESGKKMNTVNVSHTSKFV